MKELEVTRSTPGAGGSRPVNRHRAEIGLEHDMAPATGPHSIATIATLPSDERLRIRSIRPEDEALLAEMGARTAPEDLRLRFFVVTKELSHELAARLTRIDDSCEVALVAQAIESDEILGVARYFADRDNREAEFAVLVRSDRKGHGIGWALMKQLLEVARSRGVATLSGLVLRGNTRMLQFCRDLGFTITNSADDPLVVHATLALRPDDSG
jgi:acetyltransferase